VFINLNILKKIDSRVRREINKKPKEKKDKDKDKEKEGRV
jgi:hypothetical protein